MMLKRSAGRVAAAAGVIAMAGVAQADTVQPTQRQLTSAVKRYLADHGDLCLAWYSWPRDLTPEDQQSGRNEAVQLPVLERLGLVESTTVVVPVAVSAGAGATAGGAQAETASAPGAAVVSVQRYSLTAKGGRYYLHKKRETLNVHGVAEQHGADFCVAQLSLDKVVKWTPPEQANGTPQSLVSYTYHIREAPFMDEPDARKVFPVVDRIIRGEGRLLMTATVHYLDGKWVPVLPGQ